MSTVLLVDDAPEIRDFVTMFLKDEGFDVAACGAAEDALTQIDRAVPDLLILDGRLPRMSGWECLELLRASAQTVTLPVLLLTAAVDELERGQQQPPDACTAFLAKPFDLDDLLATIQEVIESCG
jgi:DNA-binding response OmpR family regulator